MLFMTSSILSSSSDSSISSSFSISQSKLCSSSFFSSPLLLRSIRSQLSVAALGCWTRWARMELPSAGRKVRSTKVGYQEGRQVAERSTECWWTRSKLLKTKLELSWMRITLQRCFPCMYFTSTRNQSATTTGLLLEKWIDTASPAIIWFLARDLMRDFSPHRTSTTTRHSLPPPQSTSPTSTTGGWLMSTVLSYKGWELMKAGLVAKLTQFLKKRCWLRQADLNSSSMLMPSCELTCRMASLMSAPPLAWKTQQERKTALRMRLSWQCTNTVQLGLVSAFWMCPMASIRSKKGRLEQQLYRGCRKTPLPPVFCLSACQNPSSYSYSLRFHISQAWSWVSAASWGMWALVGKSMWMSPGMMGRRTSFLMILSLILLQLEVTVPMSLEGESVSRTELKEPNIIAIIAIAWAVL